MFYHRLEKMLAKSRSAMIGKWLLKNWIAKRRTKAGNFESSSGSTHREKRTRESLEYITNVFDDYLKYSGISRNYLRGKRVLEIGPGDSLGVSLLFLAFGASHVVALDKFHSVRNPTQERETYVELRGSLGHDSQQLFDAAVSLDVGIQLNPDKLQYIYGHGIERASQMLGHESFDLIVSRAVLEEIHDIDAAFAVMNEALSPGGYMVHKIGLRDYGIFSRGGMHPLTFLTVPDSLWHRMTVDYGGPNRRLVDYYRQKMVDFGYEATVFITHVAGKSEEIIPHKQILEADIDYFDSTIDLVNKIRPRLLDRFNELSDEELMISGIFLVAKKPQRLVSR